MTRNLTLAALLATWTLSVAQDGASDATAGNATAAPPDFNGVWLAAPGSIGGGQAAEMVGSEPPQFTAEALRIRTEYDLFVDDPAYRCSPSSVVRVWSNPVPIEIEQQPGRVILRYEYMDAVRTVYLTGEANPRMRRLNSWDIPSDGTKGRR